MKSVLIVILLVAVAIVSGAEPVPVKLSPKPGRDQRRATSPPQI